MPGCHSKHISGSCYELAHTWSSSCSLSAIDVFLNCFKYALRLYAPLYFISGVMTRKRKEYFMKKLVKEILQSSLFLATNGGMMVVMFCTFRKLLGNFYFYSVGLMPGILSSLCAILIERKNRRGALAVYMFNQALDTTFNILKHDGYAKDIRYGEVYLFASTMALLMYMYRSNNLPDGFIKVLFDSGLRDRPSRDMYESPGYGYAHMVHCCKLSGQAFLSGFGLQAAYNLLSVLPKSFKNPEKLIFALLEKGNFRTGAFLGSFVGIYKLMEVLLSKYPKSNRHVNAALAGGVAGLSMFFQRSSYIATYLASKTIELYYMNGIHKGVFPYIKHFDSFLYAICTGIMFHAAVVQPLFLRNTYWSFLLKLTGKRFDAINRFKLDVWGLESSKIDRLAAQKKSL